MMVLVSVQLETVEIIEVRWTMDLMRTEYSESAFNGAILIGTDFDMSNDFIRLYLGRVECWKQA